MPRLIRPRAACLTSDFRYMSSIYAAPMTKQIVILGKCEPRADTKALEAAVRFVAETQPDELVIFEQSTRLLAQLREAYDGPIGVHAGSVEARFRITPLPAVYDIAPGWISTSSDGHASSTIAGNTALKAAKELGACVVMGDTHRMGVLSHSYGYANTFYKKVTGMEVGTLVDRKLARRLGGQQGLGRLTIEGQHVTPEAVPFT